MLQSVAFDLGLHSLYKIVPVLRVNMVILFLIVGRKNIQARSRKICYSEGKILLYDLSLWDLSLILVLLNKLR